MGSLQQSSARDRVIYFPFLEVIDDDIQESSFDVLASDNVFFVTYVSKLTAAVNDVCTDAISLTVNATCTSTTYSIEDATPSSHNGDIFYCNSGENLKDLWFKATVPASGDLVVETFKTEEGVDRMYMEAYSGTCSDFKILACSSRKSGYPNYDYHAIIELENRTPGEIIYYRLNADEYSLGDFTFDICAYDQLPQYSNKILLIEDGGKTDCDPISNTYDQDLIIHFRSENLPIGVRIDDDYSFYYWDSLYSNPDTITLNYLPSLGNTYHFKAELSQNGSIHTSYYNVSSNILTTSGQCIDAPANDECSGAIFIQPKQLCISERYSNLGATENENTGPFQCQYNGNVTRDVWFKSVIPASGQVFIGLFSYPIQPGFDIYHKNSCDILIPMDCYDYIDNEGSWLLPSETPGDTIYIRVADRLGDQQGEFEICVYDPIINSSCEDAIHINNYDTLSVYANELVNGEGENPSSCSDEGYYYREGWYTIEIPSSGDYVIEAKAIQYVHSRNLEIYRNSCGESELIECDYSKTSNNSPKLNLFDLNGGDTLLIKVIDFHSFEPSTFSLIISNFDPDPGDYCFKPIHLDFIDTCSPDTFTTVGATVSNANPSMLSCDYRDSEDVWFTAVIPASGTLSIETKNIGNYTTFVTEVYNHDCDSLVSIGCTTGGTPIFADSQNPGDTILIRVSEYGSDQEGDFKICLKSISAQWLEVNEVCEFDTISLIENSGDSLYIWFKTKIPESENLKITILGEVDNPFTFINFQSTQQHSSYVSYYYHTNRLTYNVNPLTAGDILYIGASKTSDYEEVIICLQSDCPDYETIENTMDTSRHYSLGKSIEAMNRIESPAALHFSAGDSIILYPGFEVELGATLEVDLDGCLEED